MFPRLRSFETLEGSLLPVYIFPEPVDGFQNLNGIFKVKDPAQLYKVNF